ncbi:MULTISPECIES: hypothetical protein [unclassified Facklamia]|uniref:hypothetical protein n=1 Tax=Aerococcaceae TaxID=186827 RepID=UPI0013B6B410|nr:MULTISPECIES: hypothetical protein [unclassified Facklamia]MBS4462468.1 hypothetical protein [Aerococcaceae bacterium zg-B36]NEW65055.1 hypothetical protein [Facklamia sp. 252]NEW68712.1 hypothetical protein [Facklamia sp. 253]QQD65120.1 hypothetical protein JDW14_07335 [Aerococcaceae bacterium zg-252]
MKVYISVNKILASLLFFFSLVPYVSLIETPFDTQPYAFIISIIIIILEMLIKKKLQLPKYLVPYFIVVIYSIIQFQPEISMINNLRSIIGYVSVFAISLAAYQSIKYIEINQFKYILYIWFFFGAVQYFIHRSFGAQIIARMSTSETRGVTSLAVEPSAYSIILIFFLLINDSFFINKKQTEKQYFVNSFFIVVQLFFAKSALGFIIFSSYLFFKYTLEKKYVKKIIGLVFSTLVLFLIIIIYTRVDALATSRVGVLISRFLENPLDAIYKDGSITDRLSHIIVSFKSLFYSKGLGFGLGQWDNFAYPIILNSSFFLQQLVNVNFTTGRIMSAWGTGVFELGIFGLILPLNTIYIFFKKRKDGSLLERKYAYVSCLTVLLIMLMSVSLAFPLFGYIIGMYLYNQKGEI